MKKYGKLVRDNIPDIIKMQNKTPVVRVLNDEEYRVALNAKLMEEVAEYLERNCLDELCDILEVVEALTSSMGYTAAEVKAAKLEKAAKNGAFEKRYFLQEVKD